jgi:hypothetical protein
MNTFIRLKPTSFGTHLGKKNLTKPYGSLELFTHTKSRENCNTLLPNTFSTYLEAYVG